MGCGRARVCVAPGHGLVVRLDDPDRGRAPPGTGRWPDRTDVRRRGRGKAPRRPEPHALRIRFEFGPEPGRPTGMQTGLTRVALATHRGRVPSVAPGGQGHRAVA